ncbi:MAG: RNA 2'-phosphotransferase [Flavobacteriaceae bacterium]
MNEKQQKRLSKFLSFILRHNPDQIGLELDINGWADVSTLLTKINTENHTTTFEDLKKVVENNDKKRFIFNLDQTKIKANQGHTISIDLNLKPTKPPIKLFHGTATKNLNSIRDKGLIKGKRHHVHLSSDSETARKVGMRYGKPIILSILSETMDANGIKFYKTENNVWLTDFVAPKFIDFKD